MNAPAGTTASEDMQVAVRFFPLSSDQKFRAARFEDLWVEDSRTFVPEVLRDDLCGEPWRARVAIDQAWEVLPPGWCDRKGIKFLGVLANLSERNQTPKLCVSLSDIDDQRLRLLYFTGFRVELVRANDPRVPPPTKRVDYATWSKSN